MIKSLRGMNEIGGDDGKKYLEFISVASKIATKYGFSFIKTPLLEDVSLFTKAVGNSSDIVSKEMYNFVDKGNNHISLRPEATAGVVRDFVEKKRDRAGGIFRYFYHGSMFRYERPQQGRLREFTQFGCESFGISSPFEDATMILMIQDIFDYFNIKFTIDINSLGCPKCVNPFKEKIQKQLLSKKDNFCEDCNKRMIENPLRVFDCKNSSCIELLEDFETITDNLCDECSSDFHKLTQILENSSSSYNINKKLVRGLDYYTKTIFEFTSAEVGSQNALCGGGRYDNLVGFIGGKETPAVGFAIGIERILPLLENVKSDTKHIYLGAQELDDVEKIFELSIQINNFCKVFVEYKKRSFTKHLANAQKLGVDIVILKQDGDNFFTKDIKTGNERRLELEEVIEQFCRFLYREKTCQKE
jgi:histidyl-tRNA synthetase